MGRVLPLLAIFLAVTAAPLDAAEAPRVEVGRVHPDLRLPTLDRAQSMALRDLRGKKVLLIQFASW